MAYRKDTALTSGTKSGSGTSSTFTTFTTQADATLHVNVSNPTGRLYLVVYLEDSPDGTNWTVNATLNINSAGSHSVKTTRPLVDNVRVRYDFRNSTSATLDATLASR